MLYQFYELSRGAMRPARVMAGSYGLFLNNPFNPWTHTVAGRHAAAACEVFERTTRRYKKPEFRLGATEVDGVAVRVSEEIVWQRPFCRIIHFKRDIEPGRAVQQPRILLVAPMSGHYATLLRGTVETLLPNHEVYITDWQDARGFRRPRAPSTSMTTSTTCARCCVRSVETCTCWQFANPPCRRSRPLH